MLICQCLSFYWKGLMYTGTDVYKINSVLQKLNLGEVFRESYTAYNFVSHFLSFSQGSLKNKFIWFI